MGWRFVLQTSMISALTFCVVGDGREMPDERDIRSRLVQALERDSEWRAAYTRFEQEIEQRLGADWWTLPPEEIRRATLEIETARGAPEHAPALTDAAERDAIFRLFLKRLDAAVPGIEHPKPLEVREWLFIEIVEERYGGMTDLAAHVGSRDLGLDLAVFGYEGDET